LSLLTALLPLVGTIQGALEDLCALSPLGSRHDDVRAWQKYHKSKEKKEDLTQKEVYERANWKRKYDKKRWWIAAALLAKAYFLSENPIKSLNEVINGAMKILGKKYSSSASMAALRKFVREYLDAEGVVYAGCSISPRSLQVWFQIINNVVSHYLKGGTRKIDAALNFAIEKVGVPIPKNRKTQLKRMLLHILRKRGIDWEVASGLKTLKFPKPLGRTKEQSKKTLSTFTNIRGNRMKSVRKLWDLTFAMLKGRRKRFGFGRYWCRNDEDWITLLSLHWDNCKVLFSEKILCRPIYDLLCLGARREDIVCEYGILLRKHHAMAVDSETSVWQPTGLAKELKANVCRKYLTIQPTTNYTI